MSSNEKPRGQEISAHPRVTRLSERAREMYLDLAQHASPDGSVVTLRVGEWLQRAPIAYLELIGTDLFSIDDRDGSFYVLTPETLDRADALARAEVP